MRGGMLLMLNRQAVLPCFVERIMEIRMFFVFL